MTETRLREAVAENAADAIVLPYAHLDKRRRIRLWKTAYDAILAGLLAYEHMASVQRTRVRDRTSAN